MPKKLSYYQAIVAEDIDNDKDVNDLRNKIDDADECKWSLPSELREKEWMREFITTAPHDALAASERALADGYVEIDILPWSSQVAEQESIENIEQALEWHWWRANRRGRMHALRQMARNTVKYGTVDLEVVYLPYEMKRKTGKAIRAAKADGDFAFRIHDPKTVHVREDDYNNLESRSVAALMPAQKAIARFGRDNPGVIAMIEKIEADLKGREKLEAKLLTTWVALFDYMDYTDRVQWLALAPQKVIPLMAGGKEVFEVLREEHKLPFINWVHRSHDTPLLKPVINAELWANDNVVESLRYFLVVATVAQARHWTRTVTGEGVDIDYSEPAASVDLKFGEEVGPFPISQLDPNLGTLIESLRGDIRQATAPKALTTLEDIAKGAPFATVNAILQASLATLSTDRDNLQASIEDCLYHMLRWVQYSEIPLIGFYDKTFDNDNPKRQRGAQVKISPEELDPDKLYITVSLEPKSAVDKQARLNQAILLERLKIPASKRLETAGFPNHRALQDEWAEEQLFDAMLKGQAQAMMQAPMMEMQAKLQQAQQQAQQQTQSPSGFDNREGGQVFATANPETREQITGETVTGEELAGLA